MFFAAPFWFTGLQLKQFARHKCYDKTLWIYRSHFFLFVQYQTQGTLVGLLHLENPSYLVLCQRARISQSLWEFSLCWVWLRCAQRKCACVEQPVSIPKTVFCMHSSTATASSMQSCPNSYQELTVWKKIQVLKRGISFKKFQNILLLRPNKPKIKDHKNQTAPVNGRKKSMAYCTMILSLKFKLRFVLQMWQIMQTTGLLFQ